MKENEAFLFIGKMPLFDDLLNDVLSITPKDWLKYKERKKSGGVASYNTDTIPLMYDALHRLNSHQIHEAYARFGKYVEEITIAVTEKLGLVVVQQAMLTRLKADAVIPRHKDKGPLTAKTHRIHVPVVTNKDCIFKIEDETKNMQPGEIWLIDNVNRYHSVENKGITDRVHLIVDAV
jgi:hypothetical protein